MSMEGKENIVCSQHECVPKQRLGIRNAGENTEWRTRFHAFPSDLLKRKFYIVLRSASPTLCLHAISSIGISPHVRTCV